MGEGAAPTTTHVRYPPLVPRSPNQVCKLSWAPDGSLAVPGRNAGEIVILERETWKVAHRLKEHRDSVNIIAYHPAGTHFASASLDGEVRGAVPPRCSSCTDTNQRICMVGCGRFCCGMLARWRASNAGNTILLSMP
jgi:WD40 repeat protein